MRFYQHYKGGIYQLLFEGKMESTGEVVVIYRSGLGQIFVRPKPEFFEKLPEKDLPRFKEIQPLSELQITDLERSYVDLQSGKIDKQGFLDDLESKLPGLIARMKGARQKDPSR